MAAHPVPCRAVAPTDGSSVLRDLRVVDRTAQIAGPYCTKLLADAGADVVIAEPPGGDPLRRWRSGALFEHLRARKRTVGASAADALVARADVLVCDAPPDLGALWDVNPALVVVTITPFGCDGPWVGRPATEFTLQAACGSTGGRGLPDEPPLAAGGRVGEWCAGTYAAVATLAAVRGARTTGRGEHVDVAMLDCMALTMTTYPSVFAEFLGWPPMTGTGRTTEVPSIEPGTDGYVVFTTNSAQQFHDFLVMIGRSDLADDRELANVRHRFARRDEFEAIVRAHTAKHTCGDLLEQAALFRIPAGPVLDGASIPEWEQFVARSVFERAGSGRYVAPRPPYKIDGVGTRRAAEPSDTTWDPRPAAAAMPAGSSLPLTGVRIVDCTAWWAGPSAPHVLGALGADVVKIESIARPDLMRYAATQPPTTDRWYEWGPLFHGVNANKRGITLDLGDPRGRAVFERLVERADVLLENYTPRVMEQWGLTWDRLRAINPRLVMVRMPAFGLDGPWRDRTGFAQTMECVAGMASTTGFPDGPPVLVRGTCDPVAGMHAAFATLLALQARDETGAGRLVESTMVEAALNIAAEPVIEAGATGIVLRRTGNRSAGAAPQGVYRCRGDDAWIAIAVDSDAAWHALRAVVDEPVWHADASLDLHPGRHAAHDAIDAVLERFCATRDPEDLTEALVAAGVPAAVVVASREIARNPQLRHRGFFEVEEHPVTGACELPTLPFRFSGVERWMHRPSPTLGQHNDEVLLELGLSDDEIGALAAAGVIGERVPGA